MKIKKVLVLPDIHYPVEDKRTMTAVEGYMASQKWDEMVYLGDVMDFNCISSHNKNNLRAVEGSSLAEDYDYVNGKFQLHRSIVGFNTKITYLEGNHEFRLERFIDANPRLKGMVEVEHALDLKRRKINWVRSWSKGEVYRIGKANFIHGIYTTEHHAKAHVMAYGENIFYGHMHDLQQFSFTRKGDNKTITAHSLGCLCDYNQKYLHGRPTKWQQAVTTFNIFEDGFFTYYVTPIFKHRFVAPNGEVFSG